MQAPKKKTKAQIAHLNSLYEKVATDSEDVFQTSTDDLMSIRLTNVNFIEFLYL
jgi:hypothetical protein